MQALEGFLRHAEHGAEAGRFLHQREILGRQALQGEAALAALEDELAAGVLQAHGLVAGHGAQDVDELARAQGGGEAAAVAVELGRGADLDLQVAGGELQLRARLAQQHVGQDGQGVAPFHDARDRLQRGQNLVLRGFENDHLRLFLDEDAPGPGSAGQNPPILALFERCLPAFGPHAGLTPSGFAPGRAVAG
jgi:hypothetical protein